MSDTGLDADHRIEGYCIHAGEAKVLSVRGGGGKSSSVTKGQDC